jgi:hypothetical protein
MAQERISLDTVRNAYSVLHDRYLDVISVGDQLTSTPPDVSQFEGLQIKHPPTDEILLAKASDIMALFEGQESE